jgi:hypothetical protein
MWIFTNIGFFSVVQKPEDVSDDVLTVRARRKEDLQRLGKYVNVGDIIETPHADYEYRVRIFKPDFYFAISDIIDAIDYSNFKDSVLNKLGKKYYEVCSAAWYVFRRLGAL